MNGKTTMCNVLPIESNTTELNNTITYRVLFALFTESLIPIDLTISFIGAEQGDTGAGGAMSVSCVNCMNDMPLNKTQTALVADSILLNSTIQDEISAWMYEQLAAKIERALLSNKDK